MTATGAQGPSAKKGDSEAPDLTKADVVAFTSRLTAGARAIESRRPDRLFNDYFAELLVSRGRKQHYFIDKRLLIYGPLHVQAE